MSAEPAQPPDEEMQEAPTNGHRRSASPPEAVPQEEYDVEKQRIRVVRTALTRNKG